ncbi:tyrosine--tRNA ligase [bacterium (Candidatus Blackallbacteria) CG17_big_fil_post_rev_8_21_14_2_50_48_46]|uniref:Tyrosine--tRNA ligase n=1 Tax=bacterium (Candidatus Blackallbacteria) CG17_big_fil_post_rev_8_21_14_2_50_48_46 TaxID=2014261 RepID=A0A2M7G299_9BACT|nr:MAG: tyrosine--tRNA ligase [bacterium (Candidatus Blackallbacteria) CG18_big_fil_WC_8_21_14_2_50_49_26]PIW15697.1 MAG: tyrosine--tRNA ligase [bacterium (Candidatus Blackallbacteria) CG17_big_fil_post_rev_8_21_14_2_50_48_46]PIW48702.1 MAG: tyrosine--tRNA ligase [bacterium (Candidatus Blackallbacteria) CG13_big_fil_rev_8_21_14_2_50_49_14]
MSQDLLEALQQRGMLEQISDPEGIRDTLRQGPTTLYIGFDPTATSLHIGNLLPIMLLAHFQRAGHRPICLVGGATGMIGDPSGRSSERVLLTEDKVDANLESIRRQLSRFLRFEGENAALMTNNHDWIGPMSYIDWLREVGKYFSVNYMIAKESVRRRLEDRDQGISYTEFSYMLLQAYDFLHLFRTENCKIQAGGNDQWGNITAGIDLVRKTTGQTSFGLTIPLLTTSSGEKFGKSAGNAVWLDAEMTSPYQFYQYWIQADDRDVERFLRIFTFLGLDEISTLCAEHAEKPEQRLAQKRLAAEVTRIVHGEEALEKVLLASEVLFGREITGLSDADLSAVFADVPSTLIARNRLQGELTLTELLRETGMSKSNGEARRLIQGGGVYLNNRKCNDPLLLIDEKALASESMLVLRSGKKNYHLARFSS